MHDSDVFGCWTTLQVNARSCAGGRVAPERSSRARAGKRTHTQADSFSSSTLRDSMTARVTIWAG